MENRPTHKHSARELDQIATGADDGSALAGFVSELSELGQRSGVEAGRALTEFVTAPDRNAEPAQVLAVTDLKETRPMIPQFAALFASSAVKAALAGGVAVAAVTGVIAVNGSPQPDQATVLEAGADSSSSNSSSTSSSTDSTTVTTGPPVTVTTSTSQTVPSSTSDTGPTSTFIAPIDGGPFTVDVDGAGIVVYRVLDGQLELLETSPSTGFTVEDESTPREIDISFRHSGGVQRVDLNIEIEDGEPRVRIENKSKGDDNSSTGSSDSDDSESDSTDDHDSDDDDDSSHGSDDDDDDSDHDDDDDSDHDDYEGDSD